MVEFQRIGRPQGGRRPLQKPFPSRCAGPVKLHRIWCSLPLFGGAVFPPRFLRGATFPCGWFCLLPPSRGGAVSLIGLWVVLGTDQFFGRSRTSGSPRHAVSGAVGSWVVAGLGFCLCGLWPLRWSPNFRVVLRTLLQNKTILSCIKSIHAAFLVLLLGGAIGLLSLGWWCRAPLLMSPPPSGGGVPRGGRRETHHHPSLGWHCSLPPFFEVVVPSSLLLSGGGALSLPLLLARTWNCNITGTPGVAPSREHPPSGDALGPVGSPRFSPLLNGHVHHLTKQLHLWYLKSLLYYSGR